MKPSGDINSLPAKSVFKLGGFRYSAVELLVVLLLLFFSAPFVEDLSQGELIETGLITLVMVSAVLAVGGQRRSLIVAMVLALPAVGARWINHLQPNLLPAEVSLVAAIVFFLFVAARLVWFVLRSPKVDANVLCAGLCGYLMLGLLWVPAYILVAQINPHAFAFNETVGDQHAAMAGFRAFYFSFITLCTVGYGDMVPLAKIARLLVILESIAGLFYMAVLLARLVAMYSRDKAPCKDDVFSEAEEPFGN
jgi:voltage-gated potassium channel